MFKKTGHEIFQIINKMADNQKLTMALLGLVPILPWKYDGKTFISELDGNVIMVNLITNTVTVKDNFKTIITEIINATDICNLLKSKYSSDADAKVTSFISKAEATINYSNKVIAK